MRQPVNTPKGLRVCSTGAARGPVGGRDASGSCGSRGGRETRSQIGVGRGRPSERVPRVAPTFGGGGRLLGSPIPWKPAPDSLSPAGVRPVRSPRARGTREASHVKLSKRHAALIATGIAGAMALTACGGGSGNNSGSSESSGGRVIFGEPDDWPENLFQGITAGNITSTQDIMGRVLPNAFFVKPDFSVVADDNLLTEEPTLDTSGGKQVNTYKISKDAVWSDGTPITADDFIYTWKSQRSPDPADGGCENVLSTNGFANIASVEGSDGGKTV